MLEISKDVENEVTLIVDHLEKFNNDENLSWMKTYKKVLKELNIKEKENLLLNTVKEITNRGYDIIDEPFKLEKFK